MSDLRSSGVPNRLLGAKKFVTWYLKIQVKRKIKFKNGIMAIAKHILSQNMMEGTRIYPKLA